MRAVGYVRVSSEEQAVEGVSLAAQEEKIRNYCALREIDLVEVIVDPGVSAGKPLVRRDGGRQVVELVLRGKVDAVIAYKLDRLFRDAADCLTVTREWDAVGAALHLVDLGGQTLDTKSAMGRFFLSVMASAAELERNLCSERTKLIMERKRARREYTGGEPPYGWRVSEDGVNLEPHGAEQQVIALAARLRESGLSLRKIGAELEDQGYRPRSQMSGWYASQVKSLLNAEAAGD